MHVKKFDFSLWLSILSHSGHSILQTTNQKQLDRFGFFLVPYSNMMRAMMLYRLTIWRRRNRLWNLGWMEDRLQKHMENKAVPWIWELWDLHWVFHCTAYTSHHIGHKAFIQKPFGFFSSLMSARKTLPKSGNNGNHLILGVDVSVMIHEGVNGGDGRDAWG